PAVAEAAARAEPVEERLVGGERGKVEHPAVATAFANRSIDALRRKAVVPHGCRRRDGHRVKLAAWCWSALRAEAGGREVGRGKYKRQDHRCERAEEREPEHERVEGRPGGEAAVDRAELGFVDVCRSKPAPPPTLAPAPASAWAPGGPLPGRRRRRS